ncbi:MAG: PEGA domain-containing protein [Fibrobacterota bacterium]
MNRFTLVLFLSFAATLFGQEAKPGLAMGTLKVFSEPAGAEIIIDGNVIGVTPLKIINIDAGERRVALRLKGYAPSEDSVQILKNETQNLSVILKPAAFLSVKAQPLSASILVNGTVAGTGEVSRMEVPPGDITLSIEAPGCESYAETLSLTPGETRAIEKTLSSVFGTLTVTTTPPGAALFINEQPAGVTPYHNEKLAPGNYKLRFELQGYEPIEGAGTLKAGDLRVIEKKMTSLYGALSVTTTPSGAALFLNDQSSGTTPYRNDKLTSGNYDLRLELPGYTTLNETVAVARDTAISRPFAFSRSKAWLDSVEAYKVAKYKHGRMVRRIVFGSIAAALAGTGYVFDTRVSAAKDDQDKIQDEYRASTGGFDTYEPRFNSAGNRASDNATTRNILYGVAGAFGLGFAISIPF